MSLVVAYHRSPTDYGICADTRWTSHIAGAVAPPASKLLRTTAGTLGWTGELLGWQHICTAGLAEFSEGAEPEAILRTLHARASRAYTAPTDPGVAVVQSSGDLIFVGPAGIAHISPAGEVFHPVRHYAIGCASEWAMGWMAHQPPRSLAHLDRIVRTAAAYYPGVGLPVETAGVWGQ